MKIKKVRSTDILVIGYIRVYLHLPYRQTEGIIKATGKNMPNHPCSYGQICRRPSRLDIDDSSSSSRIDDAKKNKDSLIINEKLYTRRQKKTSAFRNFRE